MSILDTLKHQIFEEDSTKPAPTSQVKQIPSFPISSIPVTPPSTTFPSTTGQPFQSSPFSIPTAVVIDENVYKNILDKTNFNNTRVGQIISKYFDALDDSGLDTSGKFRAAIKQASKIDKIMPEEVLTTFDTLKAAWQKEVDGFNALATKMDVTQIKSREQQLSDLKNQIEILQAQQVQVSKELDGARSGHASATQQFAMAAQRRATEIDQQRAQFAAMLPH